MSKFADQLQPGDIWFHNGFGSLYVTDEEPDRYPGMLKCYWGIGSNPNPPYSFRHPNNTTNLRLVSRLEPDQ